MAVTKTISAIRPDRVADDGEDDAQHQDQQTRCQSRIGNRPGAAIATSDAARRALSGEPSVNLDHPRISP